MTSIGHSFDPIILDSDRTQDSFKAVVDVEYTPFTEALVKRSELVHQISHRGFLEPKIQDDFGLVNVLLCPSTEQVANPQRDFDDYFAPVGDNSDPEPAPYTSVTILDRDVHSQEKTVPQTQCACLVFLADVANKIRT